MSRNVNEQVLSELPKNTPAMLMELFSTGDVQISRIGIWHYIKPAFTDAEARNAWDKICKKHSASNVTEFVKAFTKLQFKYQTAQAWRKKLAQAKDIKESISSLNAIKERMNGMLLETPYEYEEGWEAILRVIQENYDMFKAMESNEYFDKTLSTLFYPLSRNQWQDKAEAFFAMKSLVLAAYLYLGASNCRSVAAFINAMFESNFTYADVDNNTRDIKKNLQRLGEFDRPFYRESIDKM